MLFIRYYKKNLELYKFIIIIFVGKFRGGYNYFCQLLINKVN